MLIKQTAGFSKWLAGGANGSQARDITRAKPLVKELDDEDHNV